MVRVDKDLFGNERGPIEKLSETNNDDSEKTLHNESANLRILDYKYHQFRGMRASGGVYNYEGYSVAEYENKNQRLRPIAQKISSVVPQHFVLYDYKGSVSTNNSAALKVLKGLYGDNIDTIDGDSLFLDDSMLTINGGIPPEVKNQTSSSENSENVGANNATSQKKSISIPNIVQYKNAEPSFEINDLAKTLSSIIKKVPDRGGMMIGIFGKWGRGKTYLFDKMWNELSVDTNFERVNFSAWKYQDTKESWAYLYESILNQYLKDESKSNALTKTLSYLKKLWALNLQKHKWAPLFFFFAAIAASIYWTFFFDKISFIKTLISSVGVVILTKLVIFYFQQRASAIGILKKYFSKPNFKDYLGLQAEIENEIENLLMSWIPVASETNKVVLFVDDIDRCPVEKVIPILDGLRVILDNPEIHKRMIIVLAIDEDILREAITLKYLEVKSFNISKVYKEYLEKVFIIGIKLNYLEKDEIREFLSNMLIESSTAPIPDISDLMTKSSPMKVEGLNKSDIKDLKHEINSSSENDFKVDHKNENPDKLDLELNLEEKEYLIQSISLLENSTPRKIKIFYYKYLIFKKLFFIYLTNRNLGAEWDNQGNEKVITDILIHVSNGENAENFITNDLTSELTKVLKYTAQMLSPL